jgi:hypothetical protein
MKRFYRIVHDSYAGYEVQWRYSWMPFWVQADTSNTFQSVERAEEFAKKHAGGVVKFLGVLT